MIATFFFFILAVANFACESEKPQSNSQSSADAIVSEELSLGALSAVASSKLETPETTRDFFLEKGFAQVPLTKNVYQMAGLHDKRAGKPYIDQENRCASYAFVKKNSLGVAVIVVTLPCTTIDGQNTPTVCQPYFFSNSDLQSSSKYNKCDNGNSVVLDSYFHLMLHNNDLIGLRKSISMNSLCYDGGWVSRGSASFY